MASPAASGGPPSLDLQTKYNKLAAEFAKLRSQVHVLKRAVVEEQSKNNELTETLQSGDQSIRKQEQELDSLTFRNKQLEKRIGVLQEELTEISQKSSKSKKSKDKESAQQSQEFASSNLDYELVSKIEENMRLQKQLSDLEQSTRHEMDILRSQLEARDNEDTHKELILNELTSLKSDNQSINYALQNSLDEIEAYKEQVGQLREKIAKRDDEAAASSVVAAENANVVMNPPVDLIEKLKTSEQQREYWMLEYQLLKMKYERVAKKWEESKDILRGLGREDLLIGTSTDVTPVNENAACNFIGRMEVVEDSDKVLTNRSYEKEVKEYMVEKVNELVALLQLADSRAVHFYQECRSLESLLTISCGKSHSLSDEMKSVKAKEMELKEELDLTKGNYETQLTQLTEHLALMNDKIAQKQETINELQAVIKQRK